MIDCLPALSRFFHECSNLNPEVGALVFDVAQKMKIKVTILALAALLDTGHAEEETPLKYLIKCLRVDTSGGSVEKTVGTLEWPRILSSEPTAVAVGHTHGFDAGVTIKWSDDSWVNFLAANGFKRDRTLEAVATESPVFRKLSDSDQVSYSRMIDLPRLGLVTIHAYVNEESVEHPKLELIFGHHTRYFVAPQHGKAEGGADQPATDPELQSEGKEKPDSESEVRSQ